MMNDCCRAYKALLDKAIRELEKARDYNVWLDREFKNLRIQIRELVKGVE
jgi:hypothetical protein